MSIYQANDLYSAQLRSTWISDPADTSLLVTAVPDNVPTIVTVGWGTDYETVFSVEGKSGDSPSNYALTGVERIKGANENLPENTALNCLNHEEFFNQYLLTSTWYDVTYSATPEIDGDNGPKQRITLTGDATFSFSNIPDARVFLVRITQDSTGGHSITWPAGATITWLSPTNSIDDTAENTTVYGFMETDDDEYDAYLMGMEDYADNTIKEATDGATVTFDLGNGRYSKHKVTLGGNRTLALENVEVGQTFTIDLIQDATGSRTVTWWSTIKWPGGDAPDLSTAANAIDTFGFICTSADNYQGYIVGQELS